MTQQLVGGGVEVVSDWDAIYINRINLIKINRYQKSVHRRKSSQVSDLISSIEDYLLNNPTLQEEYI